MHLKHFSNYSELYIYLGHSFYFMTKKGNIYVIFSHSFSRFYKIITRFYTTI